MIHDKSMLVLFSLLYSLKGMLVMLIDSKAFSGAADRIQCTAGAADRFQGTAGAADSFQGTSGAAYRFQALLVLQCPF